MTTLILVRHGETDWNRDGRFQGHADPPLNATGRKQARALADVVAGETADAVYSSDLARARQTADIIGERLGLPVVHERALREIDVGAWQGLNHAEIEGRFPGGLDRWRAGEAGWELGESYEELTARLLPVLREIARRHPEGEVVVVGHGGTIRALRAHVAGVSVAESRRTTPAIANCDVFRIAVRDGVFAGID
jgi:2,3-bisphosphoglycerate-dependent phosphoglycerate mutase